MKITDEMVVRAKEALVSAKDNINEGRQESSLPHPEIILFPSEYEYLAEVVLTAALGDVEQEPLTEISARCEECGGQWFWPLDDRQELILTTCHEHSDPPEPLDDGLREVMGEGWTVRQLWPTPKQWHAHVSRVVEGGRLDWQNQFGEGSGPTIDAAIRAAVANATKGGEG